MINLHQIKIQGFRSFDKEQIFDLDKFPKGFYFITGNNLLEKELGSNGAGKTSLWEALCWVLYDKISTNLRAGSIKNWSGAKCKVEIVFSFEDINYHLIRSWKPNSLTLSKNKGEFEIVTQDELTSLLGMDFRSFLHSVFVSQFTSKFFDLSPADKLVSLTNILDLEKWITYSNKAKGKYSVTDSELRRLESKLSGYKGQRQSLLDMFPNFEKLILDWEEERDISIKKIERDNKENEVDLVICEKVKKEKEKTVSELGQKVDDLSVKLDENDKNIAISLASISEITNKVTEQRYKIKSLEKEKNKFENVDDECPYCFQEVTPEYLQSQLNIRNSEIKKVEIISESYSKKCREYQKEKRELDSIYNDLSETYRSFFDSYKKVDSEVKDREREQILLIDLGEKGRESIENLREKVNPHIGLELENKTKVSNLDETISKLQSDFDKSTSLLQIYKYWIKGFKDIRFLIVREILSEFELYTNNQLVALGMPDWRVSFAVDNENKSGGVTKGFSVKVSSPTNDDLVPFECWSGGEGQRLRLAGTLGLMNLISNRTGMSWDIEIFDEPTQFLNDEGIERLLDLLRQRSAESGKRIFLIDHRDFNSSGVFDGVITIEKDEEGSRIIT